MIIPFNDGTKVKVERMPDNKYHAIDAVNYDYDYPVGHGDTLMEAIIDLRDQMVEKELWSCDAV